MGKIIYPQQFSDLNPEKKANQIYQKFVGAKVYDQLAATYGGFKKLDLEINSK